MSEYLKKLSKQELIEKLKQYEKYPDLNYIYGRIDDLHGIIVLANHYMEKQDFSKWHLKGALSALQGVLIDIQSDIEESAEG
jgi:hypothetical protein